MALSINTNIASLQAQSNLNNVDKMLQQNQERLSSGLRINSAADDAAGLAISDRMTAQVRGMNQAVRNANDGISLAQTAEGGLKEITNIVQRMRELSVQAANDTNTSSDRASIQTEVDQLVEEMDRISNSTQFNGQNLLNGSFSGQFQVGANSGQQISFSISGAGAGDIGQIATTTNTVDGSTSFDGSNDTINGVTLENSANVVSGANGKTGGSALALAKAINQTSGLDVTAEAQATTHTVANSGTSNGDDLNINGVDIVVAGDPGYTGSELVDQINAHSSTTGVVAEESGSDVVLTASDGRNIDITAGTNDTFSTGVHSGDLKLSSSENMTLSADVQTATGAAASVTLDSSTVNSLDVSSVSGATTAIDRLDSALKSLDNIKSNLGAVQNRFDSVVANLDNTSQNLTEARSRIQDADIAKEAAEMTQNNVRRQAASSVLAQANQSPQLALQLLGG